MWVSKSLISFCLICLASYVGGLRDEIKFFALCTATLWQQDIITNYHWAWHKTQLLLTFYLWPLAVQAFQMIYFVASLLVCYLFIHSIYPGKPLDGISIIRKINVCFGRNQIIELSVQSSVLFFDLWLLALALILSFIGTHCSHV